MTHTYFLRNPRRPTKSKGQMYPKDSRHTGIPQGKPVSTPTVEVAPGAVWSLPIPSGSPSGGGDVTVYVCDINQPSLPTPFYSVLVSISDFMALSTAFHSINSPDNSPFSDSVLLVLSCLIGPFNYISLYESLLQP